MSAELVKRLYDDHSSLLAFLIERGEISHATTMGSAFPKVILLAAASDLESRVTEVIMDFVSGQTANAYAVSFVRNKAIARQYHTFFDWSNRSANQFFALFGDEFKRKAKEAQRVDNDLATSIKAFCEIGDLRNQLVHQNYASFILEKTAEEVFGLYVLALHFPNELPGLLSPD